MRGLGSNASATVVAFVAVCVVCWPPLCWAHDGNAAQRKPGPLPPPPNGTILAHFCGGDYTGRCGGGMGNWWSPSIAQVGDGTLVVAAEGKSRRNNAHATPTFVSLWRSTDQGASFGPAVPLLNETGTTVYGGATLVYSTKSTILRLLYTVDTSSQCHPACGAGNLSILASSAAGVAGSWTTHGLAASAGGKHFPSSGQVNSGLQMRHGPHSGRLVVPRELFLGSKHAVWPTPGGFENHAGVIFSDNEDVWTAGDLLPPPFREEESAIAELTNGSLVITARNGQNHSASSLCSDDSGEVCRVFARSDTGGQTWAQTWHVPYSVLPAARCEAAMTSVDLPGHDTGLLLFGAPMNTTTGDRTNYTVHSSLDGRWLLTHVHSSLFVCDVLLYVTYVHEASY
jgi:ribosomal protein L31